VKSFDSGDSNRDLHMLQATRGAQFPLVTVRTPDTGRGSSDDTHGFRDRVRGTDGAL
jgi:hypothetical protein